jgi:diguanylate cyclase (GGDEF)-like protein/PAS domain S-box-containing protein
MRDSLLQLGLGGVIGLLIGLVVAAVIIGRQFRRRLREALESARDARERLAQSESRYRLLAENATDVIWTLKVPELSYTYISPAVARLRGISVEQAMRETFPQSVVPEQREWVRRLIENRIRAYKGGRFDPAEPYRVELRQRTASGDEVVVEVMATLVIDEAGEVTAIQGISRDVTARVRAERELKSREAILASLARGARLLFTARDKQEVMGRALGVLGEAVSADRVYVFENRQEEESSRLVADMRFEWCRAGIRAEIDNPDMQGMPYDEAIPDWQPLLESGQVVHGVVRELPQAERELLEAQDIVSILVVPIFMDGRFWGLIGFDDCTTARAWGQAEIDALQVAAGVIGGAIRAARTEEELRRLISTDSLTGLSSRRSFLRRARDLFQAARRSGSGLALMIMDLDHFKSVNDTWGHPVGDEALKAFARICRATLREDDLIGRTGGEEFAVVLRDIDSAPAGRLAESLRRRVEQTPVELPDGSMNLTVSIGLVGLEEEVDSFGELLKRADDALYRAKRGGRNQVMSGPA